MVVLLLRAAMAQPWLGYGRPRLACSLFRTASYILVPQQPVSTARLNQAGPGAMLSTGVPVDLTLPVDFEAALSFLRLR